MLYFFHVPGASSAAAVVVEKVVAGHVGSPNDTAFAAQPPVVTWKEFTLFPICDVWYTIIKVTMVELGGEIIGIYL